MTKDTIKIKQALEALKAAYSYEFLTDELDQSFDADISEIIAALSAEQREEVQPKLPAHMRRNIERAMEDAKRGMQLNDGKERVTLPGGTLAYLLRLADAAPVETVQPASQEDFHIGVDVTAVGTHVQVWDGETKLHDQFYEMALQPAKPELVAKLDVAIEYIRSTSHGDNCFVSNHYDEDPGNRCNCGKDSLLDWLEYPIDGERDLRQTFEAWAENGGKALTHVFSLAKHPNQPRYIEGATELCWLAFQEGFALASCTTSKEASEAAQEPKQIVEQWLREELGAVESDNIGKLQFAALVRLANRAAQAAQPCRDDVLASLPDPAYIYHDSQEEGADELFEFAVSGAVDEDCSHCKRLYTENQMRDYALAAIRTLRAQPAPEQNKESK